jgi:hypothetical protein
MEADFPSGDRCLLILLGAADFTKYVGKGEKTDRAKEAFAKAAEEVWNFFGDATNGIAIPFDNRKKLFDDPDVYYQQLSSDIEEFIARRDKAIGGTGAQDIIIYYIGHGGFSHERYYLALRSTDKLKPYETGYPFDALADALKRVAARKRKYFILDCCYSGAAFSHLHQGVDAARHVLVKTGESFPEKVVLPAGDFHARKDKPSPFGTALLCAVAKGNRAMLRDDYKSTIFTSAFVDVCRNRGLDGDVPLSLWSACEEIRERMKDDALLPQCHTPEIAFGNIAHLPLFRLPRSQPPKPQKPHRLPSVFENDVFATAEHAVHCIVVSCEPLDEDDGGGVEDYVRQAIDTVGLHISKSAIAVREGPEPKRDDASGTKPAPKHNWHDPLRVDSPSLSALPIAEAFTTPSALERAVEALCRADIVVFDIGRYQPGTMLLLGVRSVVRRGVTISASLFDERGRATSTDEVDTIGAPQPFNLQMLRVTDLSAVRSGMRADVLGDKILTGLRELKELPQYLDLPAFDAVRRLGVESKAYLPVGYERQLLVLCSFSRNYGSRNWINVEEGLSARLNRRLNKLRADGVLKTSGDLRPRLARLIDLASPRLVSQTLYEAIRTTDMCIVDWSELRANVMYELGVRLAVNPLGAVHIMAKNQDGDAKHRGHVAHMMARFRPTIYRCERGEVDAYDEMITRFEESRKQGRQFPDCLVYEKIGAVLDRPDYRVAPDVVHGLVQEANLLSSDDESTGVSPVLYHDVNRLIRSKASDAATERRIAAWLYMDRRFTLDEIARDRDLHIEFRRLAVKIRRGLKGKLGGHGAAAFHAGLTADIADKVSKLRASKSLARLDSKQATLAQVLEEVRVLMEEAKIDREQGPQGIRGAIEQLKIASKMLERTGWDAGLKPQSDPSPEQKLAAAQMADCQGMIGGNLRRVEEFAQALVHFKKGRKLEEDERFEIESTYNVGNALSVAIELGSKPTFPSMRSTLKNALAAMKRRTEGTRHRDRWAWADQGQCCLLLGDFDAARHAYGRFLELGDRKSTIDTVLPVLRKLHTAIDALEDATAGVVQDGIGFLELESRKQK